MKKNMPKKEESSLHDLLDFMVNATYEMEREYTRIQRRATSDPGTAGDQGEENWATLLRGWLPSTYHIVTKGRILSYTGEASPQVDILVLSSSYPKQLIDKKLYLAAGVVAAFECKLTLKKNDIEKAIKNSTIIKRAFPKQTGSPYKELQSPILYGVLAHSRVWKQKSAIPHLNIDKYLNEFDKKHVKHPIEMMDFLCVADLMTWVVQKTAYQIINYEEIIKEMGYPQDGFIRTSYMKHHPGIPTHPPQPQNQTPIGNFISALLAKIAWNDQSIRNLAEYFHGTRLRGPSGGLSRIWDLNIYSKEVGKRLKKGEFVEKDLWNEWNIHLI